MITLHDTMTRSTSPLEPIKPGHVDVFVCGPTVYDLPHIGHAKTYTQFDLLARFLRFAGYDVTYVQNITDVDDKIIARAKERGVAPDELARHFEDEYRRDMEALGNTSVDTYARAHEHIDEIVSQIERLLDAGVAYRADDGIYYDITRFPHYGELCGRTHVAPGDSLSRVDENPNKRNPGDFAHWKARKEGDPWWPTPLGEGRPGWHIEDTAITEHFFGAQYDIHGGALDLIFPHHEAEIAQMEAISGKRPLVRHWMHTGFLQISTEKMSKSEGNMVAIRDALERAPAPVWRYLFLSQHYRSPLEFSWDRLQPAAASLERIRTYARAAASVAGDPAPATEAAARA